MTIFGPDISSYEHGLNVAALPDPFIIAKVTEGTYYRDADWPTFRDQAKASGKLLAGYHFVTGEDPGRQAANLASWIGDKSIPVMLDFEPTGNSHPSHAQQLAVADAIKALGMRVKLSYTPRWYWQQLGQPDLTGLTARGIGVVSSAYPNTSIPAPATDYAADGGDNGPGWAGYGGITPLIWQFTDAAVDGGQRVGDMNAYRGTVAQLAAFLGGSSITPSTGDIDMTPEEHNWLGQLYNAVFLGGPDMGKPGVGGGTSLVNKTDYIMTGVDKLGAAPAPTIDPVALAGAIAPLLNAQATPEAIANAVIAHLSVGVTVSAK